MVLFEFIKWLVLRLATGDLLRNTQMSLTISSHISINCLATGSFLTHHKMQNFSSHKPVTYMQRYYTLWPGECCSSLNNAQSNNFSMGQSAVSKPQDPLQSKGRYSSSSRINSIKSNIFQLVLGSSIASCACFSMASFYSDFNKFFLQANAPVCSAEIQNPDKR